MSGSPPAPAPPVSDLHASTLFSRGFPLATICTSDIIADALAQSIVSLVFFSWISLALDWSMRYV